MYVGELVRLREYRESDRDAYRAIETDTASGLRHRAGTRHGWDEHELDAYLQRSRTVEGQRYLFTVATAGGDVPVGRLVIKGVDPVHRHASLGVVLAVAARGQGLGSEAVGLGCRFAFESLNLHRLWLDVQADNERAVAVYERCGFVVESRRPFERFHAGQHRDVLVMAMLEQEWRERQPTGEVPA